MGAANVMGSMGAGAAAGASFGPYGAIIGGAAGLLGGIFSEYENAKNERERREAIEKVAQQFNMDMADAEQMLQNYYKDNKAIGTQQDIQTYRDLVDNYDPNEFVYDYKDFDYDKSVDDFYGPNRQAIIDKTADAVQSRAAGAGIGRGTGGANMIAAAVADKNEDLYRDAQNALNQDRQFAYNVWNAQIQQGQNRLNQLQNAVNTQIGMYGNLAQDYQDWQSNMMQQQLDLQQNKAANKMNLALASI